MTWIRTKVTGEIGVLRVTFKKCHWITTTVVMSVRNLDTRWRRLYWNIAIDFLKQGLWNQFTDIFGTHLIHFFGHFSPFNPNRIKTKLFRFFPKFPNSFMVIFRSMSFFGEKSGIFNSGKQTTIQCLDLHPKIIEYNKLPKARIFSKEFFQKREKTREEGKIRGRSLK